jgi:hypothetical protein
MALPGPTMMRGDMGIAGKGMEDEDGVVPCTIELAIGLIGQSDRAQVAAVVKLQTLAIIAKGEISPALVLHACHRLSCGQCLFEIRQDVIDMFNTN